MDIVINPAGSSIRTFFDDRITLSEKEIIKGGFIHFVTGPVASGKTTYCRLICGFRDNQVLVNKVTCNPIDLLCSPGKAKRISYIPARAHQLFSGFYQSLRDELYSEQQSSSSKYNFDFLVERLDLSKLLDRDPLYLSGGETARATLAISLIKNPALVVADQIMDYYYKESLVSTLQLLEEYTEEGPAVALTTLSHPKFKPDNKNRVVQIPSQSISTNNIELPLPIKSNGIGLPVLEVENLTFKYPKSDFSINPISFFLREGECAFLHGPNGGGKTTILRLLSGQLTADSGTCRINGLHGLKKVFQLPNKKRWRWGQYCSYIHQDPDSQLFSKTVIQEILSLSDISRRKVIDSDFDRIVEAFGLENLLNTNPIDLPRSFRKLIVVGSLLLSGAKILLLDEPSSGLDMGQLCALLKEVEIYLSKGNSVLFITHDPRIDPSNSTLFMVEGGSLTIVH